MGNFRLLGCAIAGVALVLAAARPVAAGSQDACSRDISKFCSNAKPGGGRIALCLQEHSSELSAECKTALKDLQRLAEEHRAGKAGHPTNWTSACGPTIQKLCKGVKPGGGRIAACLRSHESELPDACKTAFSGLQATTPATPAAK